MDSNRFVNLERIINEFSLEVLYGGTDYKKHSRITVDSVGTGPASSWWGIFSISTPIGSS